MSSKANTTTAMGGASASAAAGVRVVLLAGRIRPSPLREALDVHVLCLPVGHQGNVLHAWLDLLQSEGIGDVCVVVNTTEDVDTVGSTLSDRAAQLDGSDVRVIAEPAAWRGAAGILRDVIDDLGASSIVVACEGKLLPPRTLAPIFAPLEADASMDGVVGVCGEDEPAGIYAFRREALSKISRVGYCDLKEQFLPNFGRNGGRVTTAQLGDAVWRLRDLESYLATVRQSLACDDAGPAVRISPRASVSGSAVIDGGCIVESGAVVEDGAVVHDSVVLWGATVGGGAVVSRSVVGPLAVVEPRSRVVRSFVARPGLKGNGRITSGSNGVGSALGGGAGRAAW